jgi:hypothetical protein
MKIVSQRAWLRAERDGSEGRVSVTNWQTEKNTYSMVFWGLISEQQAIFSSSVLDKNQD